MNVLEPSRSNGQHSPPNCKDFFYFAQQCQTKLDSTDSLLTTFFPYVSEICCVELFQPFSGFTSLGDTTPRRSAPPLKQQQLIWSPPLVPDILSRQTRWKRPSAARHASCCLSCYFTFNIKHTAVQHLLNKIEPISSGLEELYLLTFSSSVKMISVQLIFCEAQGNILKRFQASFGTMLYHCLS